MWSSQCAQGDGHQKVNKSRKSFCKKKKEKVVVVVVFSWLGETIENYGEMTLNRVL